MTKVRLTDLLFHSGWLLFFAGIPFSGLSAPGLLLVLIHWAVARPKLAPDSLRNPQSVVAYRLYQTAVIGLIAAYLGSTIVAANRLDALGATIGYGLALLFGSSYAFRLGLKSPGWWRRYLWVVPLSGTAHATLGIVQYVQSGTRVMGIHGNPNTYSTVLLVGLFLGAAALTHYTDWRRWLTVPYAVVVSVAMLATGSRGAWVGALAGVLAVGVLLLRNMWCLDRRRTVVFGLAGAVLLVLIVGGVYYSASPAMQARMVSIMDIGANQDRVVVYQTMWDMFLDNPLLGVGGNNIKHRFAEYQGNRPGSAHELAHNYFLQSLGETGVVGTGFLVLLWFVWLYYGRPKSGAPTSDLLLYSLGIALLVRDQFDNALTILYLLFLLNWLGGTLVASSAQREVGA